MGCCQSTPIYSFDNFITIQRQMPRTQTKVGVQKFVFQIHPFSEDYIRQRIDCQFNPDTDGTEQSFLVSEEGGMKVFESKDELITKRDKISSCLETALVGKLLGESGVHNKKQKKVLVFVQPLCREDYKRILFNIIIETLISVDMTCYNEQRGRFGVYFDWPLYLQDKKPNFLEDSVRDIDQMNKSMDTSKGPKKGKL